MSISSWTRFYRDEHDVQFGAEHLTLTDAQLAETMAAIEAGPVFRASGEVVWFKSFDHPAHQTVWVRNHPASGVGCLERDSELGPDLAAKIPPRRRPALIGRLELLAAALDMIDLPGDGARTSITVAFEDVEQSAAISCAMAFMADRPSAVFETYPGRIQVTWPQWGVPAVIELHYRRSQAPAARIASGEPVTVHAATSRYDGREGTTLAPDEEGGYAVTLEGELDPLHFELAELSPRRLVGATGGGAS